MRRLQSGSQHRIEDRFAARTSQLVMYSVEFDLELNLAIRGRLNDWHRVFLVGQRNKPFGMNSCWRDFESAKRFERALHERLRTAYVAVRAYPRSRQFRELRNRRQTLNRIERVNHLHPGRMLIC